MLDVHHRREAGLSDPRPVVSGGVLRGARCAACAHPVAVRAARCPRCGGELQACEFGPEGVVWSVTTLHVASGGRQAPYTLTYVDLDDGPRLLAHVEARVEIGARVRLAGLTAHGDPLVTS